MDHVTYDFRPFDCSLLTATAAAWQVDSEQDYAFPGAVDDLMNWVRTHTERVNGEAVAYGVFPKESEEALAICECVFRATTRCTHWVKFLKMTLRPELENRLEAKDLAALRTTLDVYRSAVFGVLQLKMDHKAPIMKIYGRSYDQLMFLQSLAIDLADDAAFSEDHTTEIEGRWLVTGPRSTK